MRIGKTMMKLALTAAVCVVLAGPAHAIIAYNYPSGLPGAQPDGPYSLGMVFNVSSPIYVTALGAFDQGANGIGGSGIDVAVYNISGGVNNSAPLAVASVHFSGTAQPLLSGTSTRLSSITPVLLGSGTYMVVANHYGDGEAEVDYNPYWAVGPYGPNAASANAAYGVTYGGGWNANGALSWGSLLPGAWNYDYDNYYHGTPQDPRFAAGNFAFTPVPEAAGFAMAGVGLLGFVYGGRCYWLRRKLAVA